MKKHLPKIILALASLGFLASLRPARDTTWAFQDFGKLPIVANGRFQPMDSLARNSLLQLREKQSIYLKEEKRSLPAIEWLMEVLMNPEKADTRRAFRIDHPELKSLLQLPEAGASPADDGKHFAWKHIEPKLDEMEKQSQRISQIESAHRSPFEEAVMKLQTRLFLYMRLKNTLHPQDAKDFKAELARFQEIAQPGVAAFRARQAGQTYDENILNEFSRFVGRFDVMIRMETPLLIPPIHGGHEKSEWQRMGEAIVEVLHGHDMPEAVTSYATLATAFRQEDVSTFNKTLGSLLQSFAKDYPQELTKVRRECFYNRLQAFYKASTLYVLAFILACGSWFVAPWMRPSAVGLTSLAFLIHTSGLLFRMFLEGRPPVTNLYSSAIFIGWGAVVLGLILERFYKDGIGTVVASSVGFITLVIAHNLSLDKDTMTMMEAVLDTNFWLATHVVVITLGYASTFVAGFLAMVYLLRGVFTRTLTPNTEKSLARMVYGIICFATLFSFVGTVLGGIWADQSWGRFWGWDPKENGALIIVLWNALILHARWGGMIRERGLMNLAIVGNIVTSWSWFGVNLLSIGLHSYGFTSGTFRILMLFIASQLFLVGLGLLPKSAWASFKASPALAPETKPPLPATVP